MLSTLLFGAIFLSENLLGEDVGDLGGVDDGGLFRDELEHEFKELFNGVLADVQNGVVHHEVDEGQELLELTELVGLLGQFVDVEPSFSDVLEGAFADFLQLADPTELTGGKVDLRNAGDLVLSEFFDSHGSFEVNLENTIVSVDVVTFLTDLNHRPDDLVFDKQGLKAEVRELLWEVVLGDGHLAEERYFFDWGLWRKGQVGGDHVLARLFVLLTGLLHNDLVHGAAKIELYFNQDFSVINWFVLQESTLGSHLENAAHLLSVELGKILLGHIVDEEVIANLRVGIDALGVGLGDTLGKDPGVLRVEEEVDSGQLNVLVAAIVPVAGENLALIIIGLNEDGFPRAGAIVVFLKTPSWNRTERAIGLLPVGDPLAGLSAVILGVVEGLKREPVGGGLHWVAVVDTLLI